MDSNKQNKIMLGFFVVAGATLFIMGIFFIGEKQRLFAHTFRVKFICRNVNGLQPGNNVRFSGIDVGTVSTIQIISDSTVRVEMLIDRGVRKFIRKDAQASVGSEGLMGDKVVDIAPGFARGEIANNDTIHCGEGSSIEEIMAEVKIVAENAATITGDLASITDNIREGKGTIGKLFMDSTLAKNFDQTVVNVKEGAGGFKQDMVAAQHSFLLKGYFKKKEKEQHEKEKEQQEKTDK
jgi:phospholipid/cholesterol/gamma-HCH transport system substrate-binding protein